MNEQQTLISTEADAETDTQEDQAQGEAELSIKERAAIHGHRSREEFKGDPANYKDEEAYIEDVETMLPLAINSTRILEKKVARLEKQNKRQQRFFEQNLEIARAEAERKVKDAFDNEDKEAFDQAQSNRDRLKAMDSTPEIEPAAEAFMERNSWYGRDDDLTALATGLSGQIAAQHPDFTVEQNLKEVEKRIKSHMPEKTKQRATPIEPGRKRVPVKKSGFMSLDDEHKANFDYLVGQKIYADDDDGRKNYYASVAKRDERLAARNR